LTSEDENVLLRAKNVRLREQVEAPSLLVRELQARLALAVLSRSDCPYINQQAADWMRLWTFALLLVAVVWSGSWLSVQRPSVA
jgi:hypothetical protein